MREAMRITKPLEDLQAIEQSTIELLVVVNAKKVILRTQLGMKTISTRFSKFLSWRLKKVSVAEPVTVHIFSFDGSQDWA